MTADCNETKLIGTIGRLRDVPTRSCTKMVKLLLQVRKEMLWVIALKGVATAIRKRYVSGDRLSVTGIWDK